MKTVILIVKILVISLIFIPQTSCEMNIFKNETELNSSDDSTHVKGMFVSIYCHGALLIKILDESNIARTWTSTITPDRKYENCVVANLDTSFNFEQIVNAYLLSGTIFYFNYTNEVRRDPTYVYCDMYPFITITNLSKNRK